MKNLEEPRLRLGRTEALILVTPAVVAEHGVVYPPAVLGHGGVDSGKPGVGAAFPPGHQAVDPALAHKRTPRVPLRKGTSGMTRYSTVLPGILLY